ncbi:rRNA maturation RNase YbeY [Meridianimarinicoccus sp. RP-17]|uniref:rRNA maturation RNase YbeY n=1 Tax=Meridianimarinicoccus zhengii TaxID=2056810 RepID=UPI000DAD2CDD|nr:rRNA maturation RNase YbeY [Phycocomes zhengii]
MPPLVDTLIDDPAWDAAGLEALAQDAARATLRHLGLDPAGFEISLMGCDDARIASLNTEFRGKPAPTNVLSWPSGDRAADTPGTAPDLPEPGQGLPMELGDIAIAYGTCAAEADVAGIPLRQHVSHLIVHGILHLLGYDHIDDADADLMEGLETAILAGMGLPDPYRDRADLPVS